MKLKFIPPPKPEMTVYNKMRLYKYALREACNLLCLEGEFKTPQSARIHLINKAMKKL